MQGNRSISIKEKISIVCEVLSGKPKRAVAREYKVSRPSVHTWTRKGLDALRVALQPEKRGPKFKRESSPLQGEAKKEVQKLKRVIKKKEKQIKNLQKKNCSSKKRHISPSEMSQLWIQKNIQEWYLQDQDNNSPQKTQKPRRGDSSAVFLYLL